MLGSRRRSVGIVPDYTLFIDEKAVLVLDAKAPSEDASSTEHLGQAYSYAIHPDIRCDRYAICNGRRLVIHGVSSWEPEGDIDLSLLDNSWNRLEAAMGTDALTPQLEDPHTAWFYLLGALLSPNTPAPLSANAAYRLSWYMPRVDASRKAAAQAAMANLSASELITILRAGGIRPESCRN